jgi:hypothetical protein
VTQDDWTLIEAPAWLSGGEPAQLFEASGMRVRVDTPGNYFVRTEESYRGSTPHLISARHLFGGGRPNRLSVLAGMEERATIHLDYATIQAHLDGLVERVPHPGGLVHVLSHAQGVLLVTPPTDLPTNAGKILDSLTQIRYEDQADGEPGPFHSPGLAVLGTTSTLQLRLRLPSIFLRRANDERLARGDTTHRRRGEGDEDMLFPSSHGLYEGIYLLDPYAGPLRGSMSPSIWCLAAPRTFGTVIVMLGRAIAGTVGDATEPLQTILVKGPNRSYRVPEHVPADQPAAVEWWARALNLLFGILSDPAVFRTKGGVYDPAAHLGAILTIEQLFRRVTSLLVQHRDVTARLALLFTCLDTLEGLTGRNLVKQCESSHAANCLGRVRLNMSEAARRVLLPCAERAATALEEIQGGFSLARQEKKTHLAWANKTATLEQAAAHYIAALRNATHGHGGHKGTDEQRARDSTLLIQHNGKIPDDLPLLAYLYLLDLLNDPKRFRRILSRRAG